MIRAVRLPPWPTPYPVGRSALPARHASAWALFWNDRQAIRLKVTLLILCVAMAAMLEAPW